MRASRLWPAGSPTDFQKTSVLASGYALAAMMTLAIVLLPLTIWTLGGIFILGGIYVAMEETLEDSFCAELVGEEHHGMAFGTLATVNGVGDFVSSIVVGTLWTAFGTTVAFGFSGVLFVTGSLLVWRSGSAPSRADDLD